MLIIWIILVSGYIRLLINLCLLISSISSLFEKKIFTSNSQTNVSQGICFHFYKVSAAAVYFFIHLLRKEFYQ